MVVAQVTQEDFDEAVKSNVEELGMEPPEAIEAAVEEFQLLKADLTGINKSFYEDRVEHPVKSTLADLSRLEPSEPAEFLASLAQFQEILTDTSRGEDFKAQALSLAESSTVVEQVVSALRSSGEGHEPVQLLCLQVLANLLVTRRTREAFNKCHGVCVVADTLRACLKTEVAESALLAAAQACFKNEDNKAAFVREGGDDLILAVLRDSGSEPGALAAACKTLRSITLADDDRPCMTSGAFKTAREICRKGGPEALLGVLRGAGSSAAPVAAGACSALRRVAVTDDACKVAVGSGGAELLLATIRAHPGSEPVARTAMSALRQLANSDANKGLIIAAGALDAAREVCSAGAPGSCEQALGLVAGLALRNPEGARAAASAGLVEATVRAMEAMPAEQWVQRQACMVVRNLVARTPEFREPLLERGAEALLRRAQRSHPEACRDVGGAALRDLGAEDYDIGVDSALGCAGETEETEEA